MEVPNISIELVAIAFLSFLIFAVVSLVGIPASLIAYVYAPTLSFRDVVITLAACTVAAGIGLSPRQPLLLIPVGLFLLIFGRRIVEEARSVTGFSEQP